MTKFLFTLFLCCSCMAEPFKPSEHITPLSVPVWTAPDVWLDFSSKTYINSTITQDNEDLLANTITRADATAGTSTPLNSGALIQLPSIGPEGLVLNGKQGATWGTNADFKAFHNGTDWEQYFLFNQIPLATSTAVYPLMRTVGTAINNSQIGFEIGILNSTTNPATVRAWIASGSGGTQPYLLTCSNNSIDMNGVNQLHAVYTSGTLNIYVKNSIYTSWTSIGSDAVGSGLSSANSTSPLTLAWQGNAWQGYINQYLAYTKTLSPDETDSVQSFLNAKETAMKAVPWDTAYVVTVGPAQSNGVGVASNPGNAPTGKLGSKVFYLPSNSDLNQSGYWTEMELGLTTSPTTPTKHGPFPRFGYEMSQAGKPIHVIWRPLGATKLIANPVGTSSWTALTPINSTDLYPYLINFVVTDGLWELKHILHKVPKLIGNVAYQGETDAANSAGYSAYAYQYENWISIYKTDLTNKGYDVSNMKFVTVRICDISASNWQDIRDAQDYVSTNYGDHLIPTDGLPRNAEHLTTVGYDSVGYRLARYFKLNY